MCNKDKTKDKDEENKSKEPHKAFYHINNLNIILSSIIVFACTLGLLFLLGKWGCWVKEHNDNKKIPEYISIQFDPGSSVIMTEETRTAIVESLNNIMLQREQILANKYQYIIDKRAFEDSLLSVGRILIGIIIAVLGFFGYKSFQSIEDKAKKTAEAAETAASKAASKAADTAASIAAEATKRKTEQQIQDITRNIATTEITKILKDQSIINGKILTKDRLKEITASVSSAIRDSIMEEIYDDINEIRESKTAIKENTKSIEAILEYLRTQQVDIDINTEESQSNNEPPADLF